MRGRWVHNDVLLGPPRKCFEARGARVVAERRVGPGRAARAVDLCADFLWPVCRVVVEADGADGTRTRVRRDRLELYVAKADALAADVLLLVVRTGGVAATVRRHLRHLHCPAALEVLVYTQPQAVAWIRRRWPIVVRVEEEEEQKDKKERKERKQGRRK